MAEEDLSIKLQKRLPVPAVLTAFAQISAVTGAPDDRESLNILLQS
jgi:hypothetical protein